MYLYRYDKPLKLYRLFKYYDFKAAEIIYKYCTVSEKRKINVKYYPSKIDRTTYHYFPPNFSIPIFPPSPNLILINLRFSYFFFFYFYLVGIFFLPYIFHSLITIESFNKIEKWKGWNFETKIDYKRGKVAGTKVYDKIGKFSLRESFEWDFHRRRGITKFSRPIMGISIQWIQWIPGKHLVWFSDSMRRTMGRGIRSRKIQGSAFWKAWKIPENKGPRPSSSSPIEIRHADGRGAMENDGRTVSGECFIVQVRQLRIAVRRSRAHSCGSHLWRHPWNLVETPLVSSKRDFDPR